MTARVEPREVEPWLVTTADQRWVLRRPPRATIAVGANDLAREHRVLTALHAAGAPVPHVLAPLPGGMHLELGPMILMEWIDGVSITDTLPDAYPRGSSRRLGEELIDALAAIHAVQWPAIGLGDFGRPEGYLARQVTRLMDRVERQKIRDLPDAAWLGDWLERHLPKSPMRTVIHGDFHLDNTLFEPRRPKLAAVIDFELSTIGDPLTDLGLVLGLWGERLEPIAMPRIQAVTRGEPGPSRRDLAQRYASVTGRSVDHLEWYVAFALWRLACIVEGAYAQYRRGETNSEHARALERDVPALLAEARAIATGSI